jgi:Mg2+-importing ATPase
VNKDQIKKLEVNQLIEKLDSSINGLTDSEATSRLLKYGKNVFKNSAKLSAPKLILKQFKSSLIYLLVLATILAFALGDTSDGIIILIILLINTSLGFYQEFKSENAVEKLQKLVSKEILVKRDGKESLIAEQHITVGDLVVLRQGDIVPADIRLIKVTNLSVNESELTGESVAISKTTIGDNSIVFAGSTIEQGEAEGFVFAIADNTELGKIAHLSNETKKVTKYEQSLSSFSSFLVRVTFLTLAVVFILKMFIVRGDSSIIDLGLFIVALSITVVPEAMPVIATLTLSKGAMKLAKQHVIVKTLTAAEDLGNINILCSDKTGTLTQNILTVTDVTTDNLELFQLLAIASLETLDEKRKKFQSSFDRAFIDYVPKDLQKEADSYKRLSELPFDPASRRRRVIFTDHRKTYLVEIGSVETLLTVSREHKHKKRYLEIIKKDGQLGLRHLGIAYKIIDYGPSYNILKHEDKLKFVGFAAMEDPLRPTTKHTINLAKELGLKIKILSGDSREVTHYVASEVGLINKNQAVFIGDELDNMSSEQFDETVLNNDIFARLNPEQKYKIINVLKKHGNTVGYQGDGINDAPALKLADVAIAVNNATDVAQESADILLLRNDLGVIVNGIKFGRTIFSNINKYIRYTMIANFGNFFALSALYLLSSTTLPLLPIQLILISLLTDIPLITIATDNVEVAELQRPSKYNTHALMFISIFLGSFTALFIIMFYTIVNEQPIGIEQTALFLFINLTGLIIIFSVRNKDHFWKAPEISWQLKTAVYSVGFLSIGIIYLSFARHFLTLTKLPLKILLITLVSVLIYLFVLDLIKVWFYRSKIGNNY